MKKIFNVFWRNVFFTIKHYGWLSLVIIPVLLLVNWTFFSVLNSEKATLKSQQISLANEEVNIIDFIISNTINNSFNDISVMIDSDEMSMYLENKNETNLSELKQLLYRIISNKPQFSGVEFLDLTGQQIIWLNRVDENLEILNQDFYVNRSNKEYFPIIQDLNKDQMYIVPIYLLKDNVSGTEINKPVTSLVMAIFDDSNQKKGYLVLNYNANHLLAVFNEYVGSESPHIELGIINGESIWGLTPGFDDIFGVNEDEIDDYFDLLEANAESIIRNYVNLTSVSDNEIINDEHFFRIFASIDFQAVYNEFGGLFVKHPFIIVFVDLSLLVLFFFFASILKSKDDDRILLNANMYLSDKNVDGVMITNSRGEITYTNQSFEDIFGYKLDKIKNKKPDNILGNLNFGIKDTVIKSKQILEDNIWNLSNNNIIILKHIRIKPELNRNGDIKHLLAIYSTPKIEIESLTFISDIETAKTYELLAKPFKNEEFKYNNSCIMIIRTFNEKSNKLYDSTNNINLNPYAFANYLSRHLGTNYMFAVPKENYLMIYASLEEINLKLQEVVDLIDKYKHEPNINNDLEYFFGIALADEKTTSINKLIENAFVALTMVKNSKNVKHLIYTPDIRNIIKREKTIYSQLDNGFSFNEFYLHYQIQKNILNNTYNGVEALLRWNNSKLGNIPPAEFIGLIENSFYINRLSLMVINKVIDDFTPYIKYLNPNFKISINLTYFDFFNDYIIHGLLDAIDKSQIPSSNFCFEITESGYLENKQKTNVIIDYLHSKGIIIAIDDFGTGFSSLEVLKNIRADKIKIDRTFIKDYPDNDNGEFFETIVKLIKSMNLDVLVEGTETKEQVDLCFKNGCDEIQGYFISKPIEIKELIKQFINKNLDS